MYIPVMIMIIIVIFMPIKRMPGQTKDEKGMWEFTSLICLFGIICYGSVCLLKINFVHDQPQTLVFMILGEISSIIPMYRLRHQKSKNSGPFIKRYCLMVKTYCTRHWKISWRFIFPGKTWFWKKFTLAPNLIRWPLATFFLYYYIGRSNPLKKVWY